MWLKGRCRKTLEFCFRVAYVLVLLTLSQIVSCGAKRIIYTNKWAVKFLPGVPEKQVQNIALQYGFVSLGRIIDDYFLLASTSVVKRSKRSSDQYAFGLTDNRLVVSAEQQIAKHRSKRDFLKDSSLQNTKSRSRVDEPNDPEWKNMWYLNSVFHSGHSVKEAWDMGVTGKDVVVTILDDGLEYTHPDIRRNYDPMASFDVNNNDADPTPHYDATNDNRHGTRCAGEVAAVYNNSMCIVGVAHGAYIGGIKMLDGDVTDAVEAASLSHNRQHIDIYSASWGPDDDGKSLDGPEKLTYLAFRKGVEVGRGGKGSIFVWASGNGGREMDNCNCDGYTNSIYTLSISSATERGQIPWYSEPCSSTMATTYSSGAGDEKHIVTTDVHNNCTDRHTGTSASAPLAAGICALALEANPSLTWRDLQHIVVRTARSTGLRSADWRRNGSGRNVSHHFGYGLMDAAAMVRLARRWSGAGLQQQCRLPRRVGRDIKEMSSIQETIQVNGNDCTGDGKNVVFLEHVVVAVTLNVSGRRGDIHMTLTSPQGTKSIILDKRANDANKKGFGGWPFMTVHCWGEKAVGIWTLLVQNDGSAVATLVSADLVMYGTREEVGESGIVKPLFEFPTSSSASLATTVFESKFSQCCSFSVLGMCTGALLVLIPFLAARPYAFLVFCCLHFLVFFRC